MRTLCDSKPMYTKATLTCAGNIIFHSIININALFGSRLRINNLQNIAAYVESGVAEVEHPSEVTATSKCRGPARVFIVATHLSCLCPHDLLAIVMLSSPPGGVQSIMISMFVCLFVCLSVHLHNSKTARPNFTNFCTCCLWPYCSSVLDL